VTVTSAENASSYFVRLGDLTSGDVARVGGKNASLGELIRALRPAGINVPPGFATTAQAYWDLLAANHLTEPIEATLAKFKAGKITLATAGKMIRQSVERAEFPPALAKAITGAYRDLGAEVGREDVDVAVRSSATAEDLPTASFAGQLETFLNVVGEAALLGACRRCFASLFTDRAIAYRETHGFEHMKVALSIGVQQMVRADKAGAGVLFTIDTETGFPDVVLINAGWGLGENVVRGTIGPDQYLVFKPLLDRPELTPIVEKTLGDKAKKLIYASGRVKQPREAAKTTRNMSTTKRERASFVLTDIEVLTLARWGCAIETHYGRPMDVEWAKDGETGQISIVQARPETVQSRRQAAALKTYTLERKGRRLLTGVSVGGAIAAGKGAQAARPGRTRQVRRRRDPGHGDDGSGLGPDHEAGSRDRHGSRRAHVARSDRQPRDGVAGDRRHRQGDPGPEGWPGDHRLVRRRRRRPRLRGDGADRDPRNPSRVTAEDADEDHAHHGEPRRRVALVAPTGRWGGSRADRVHHWQPHPGAPDGARQWDKIADRAVRRQIAELTARFPEKSEYLAQEPRGRAPAHARVPLRSRRRSCA